MRRLAVVSLFGLTFAVLAPLLLLLIAACWLATAVLALILSVSPVYKSRQTFAHSPAPSVVRRPRAASRAS